MIVSRSEYGAYRYDGEKDMKVLRRRAEDAVRYFKTRDPKYETVIFGCPVSTIDNGKLSDNINAYRGNVIQRCLHFHDSGYYAGKMTFSYNDSYNDGRGQGGNGSTIIGDVTDVRIEDGHLVVEGRNGPKSVSYRYLIQERPDDKPFTSPIPKGGKVPEIVPTVNPPGSKAVPKYTTKAVERADIQDFKTPSDYRGPLIDPKEIAAMFREPVECRFLNRGWTVWMRMRYPVQGLSNCVDTEAYRIVKGEKRYGNGTYLLKDIESDGRYLKVGRSPALWYIIDGPVPWTSEEIDDGSLCVILHDVAVAIQKSGQWYAYPYTGERLPLYTVDELSKLLSDPSQCPKVCDMFLTCYLSNYSEHWSHWSEYGVTYGQWKSIMSRLRKMRNACPVKGVAGPISKPVKPTVKTAPKKAKAEPKPIRKEPKAIRKAEKPVKPKVQTKKAETVTKKLKSYEVRVDGRVEGTFSSKSKAESLKKDLKSNGMKARIYVVFA